jgi:uroporphyrinogen decarboxylase
MDKRERLQAALTGARPDRLPVALWRHFPVDDQAPEYLAAATIEWQAVYNFDFVKVTPASSFCLKDWGIQDEWRGNPEGTRDYVRRAVSRPTDWRRLRPLDPRRGALAGQLDCLRKVIDGVRGETPVLPTIFSPLAQAKHLAGEARLFEHLHSEPQALRAGLETITVSTIAFIEAALAAGADGIFYAVQHASLRLFDVATYRQVAAAYDRRIVEAAGQGWLNILHLHGESPIFELALELPVQVVNWHDRHAGPNLSEGKRRFAGAVCGGLRREETLVLGSPDRVRAEARQALRAVGGRGLILGAGCVVPILAPRANLRAARMAVEFA